jgi:steroid delta-isomerase-like uncharacterized protein
MKLRPVFLAVALASLAACTQQAEPVAPVTPPPAPVKPVPPPPPPESKKIVADYMAAWNSHDPEQAGSFIADDGVYVDVTVGTPQVGRRAAIDNVIAVFMRAVPDCKWEMRGEPIATGNGIAFEWTFSGINTGGWGGGITATNQRVNLRGVSFIRIKDGKIAYQGDYYDAATLNKQMGW